MSNSPISSNPRLLLFPQVERTDPQGQRPKVRRYTLTLLSGAGTAPPKAARPSARGLTTV
ncbi:MAG TPA: hypothetical protein VIJ51_10900 [Solirubrobacteraceae bacterium]